MKTKLFTFFAALVCAAQVFAYDFEVGGIYYNLLGGNSVEVTYGSYSYEHVGDHSWINYNIHGEYSGSVTIPSMVSYNSTTYHVTAIGDYAFRSCDDLTSVTIPYGVTTIGDDAFCYCDMLPSITIPNSVTTIGEYAFSSCLSLTSVIGTEYCKTIGEGAFHNCSKLTSIPPLERITKIERHTFAYCSSLTGISIPANVTVIGDSAFFRCDDLKDVSLGSEIQEIGYGAFHGCSNLSSTTYRGTIESWCNIRFNNYSANPISQSHHLTLFYFDDKGWNRIDLTELEIPEGVTKVSKYAFYNCTALTYLSLPATLTSIETSTFYGCTNIVEITCLATNPPIITDAEALSNVKRNIPLYVPEASIDKYATADYWKEFTDIRAIGKSQGPITLYVQKPEIWENIYLYTWLNDGAVQPHGAWPGTKMIQINEDGWYYYTFDPSVKFINYIFNIGPSNQGQTKDLSTSVSTYTILDRTGSRYWVFTEEEFITNFEGYSPIYCDIASDGKIDYSKTPKIPYVSIIPTDDGAEITWPKVNNAHSYKIIIWADAERTEKVCTLTFNAQGKLIDTTFERNKPAVGDATTENFACSVTGLESGTTYAYSIDSYDGGYTLLEKRTGQFTTTASNAVEDIVINSASNVRKVLENGTLYIIRDGEKYTIDGRKVE